MGNSCCSCAGRPSKKHRAESKIEKSPSLKSVKMMPLSTILGSSSTHSSMSSINLQTIPEENRKTGSETEQDDSCYDSGSADGFSENNDEWLPQKMMGTLTRGFSLYVTGEKKKKREPEEAEEALEF